MLNKYKYTLRGALIGLLLVVVLLAIMIAWLVIQDLLHYEGSCSGGIFPFLGQQQQLDCSFTEYLQRNAWFSFQLFIYYRWYLLLVPLLIAVILGWFQDSARD